MEENGQFHAQASLFPGIDPRYPLDGKFFGDQVLVPMWWQIIRILSIF